MHLALVLANCLTLTFLLPSFFNISNPFAFFINSQNEKLKTKKLDIWYTNADILIQGKVRPNRHIYYNRTETKVLRWRIICGGE